MICNPPAPKALLMGLLLVSACSGEQQAGLTESTLRPVWERAPEIPDEEPWFGANLRVDVLDDLIAVGDIQRKTVLLLDGHGEFLKHIGSEGHGPGEYRSPTAVSFTRDGLVCVQPGLRWIVLTFDPEEGFLHRTVAEPLTGMFLGRPFAVADSVFAFGPSPSTLYPSHEDLVDTPLILLWDHGDWTQLGTHDTQLPESIELKVSEYSEISGNSHEWMFRRGVLGRGTSDGQLLFIRSSNPYEVHKLERSGTHSYATYFEPASPPSAVRHTDIPEETYEDFRARVPLDFFLDQSSSTGTRNYVTFTDALRGYSILDGNLYVYVEHLLEDNALRGEVFQVDLESMRLLGRYEVGVPKPMRFAGITNGGLLIFHFVDPVPGLMAMAMQ